MASSTIELIALTPAVVDAMLAGDHALTDRYGVSVAPGYLDFPEMLPALRVALVAGTPPEWLGHLILHRESLTVVGFGGFKGPPVGGEVEIGYSVAPAWQGRGHAAAAVAQLVARARAGGLQVVSAHTRAEESASTRLLERAGFARTGVVVDEELGEIWRFELRLDV